MCVFGLAFGFFVPRERKMRVDHLRSLSEFAFYADCVKHNVVIYENCINGHFDLEKLNACHDDYMKNHAKCNQADDVNERRLMAGGQDGFSDNDFGDSSGSSPWRRRLATVKKPNSEQIAGCYYRADVSYRNCIYNSKANEDQADQSDQVKACNTKRAQSEARCEFFSYLTAKQLTQFLEAETEQEADPKYDNEEFGSCATSANFDNAACRHLAYRDIPSLSERKAQQQDCDNVRQSQIELCPSQ